MAEIYYRMRLNSQFEISPDVQWVQHSGADQTRQALVTAGVRLQLTF